MGLYLQLCQCDSKNQRIFSLIANYSCYLKERYQVRIQGRWNGGIFTPLPPFSFPKPPSFFFFLIPQTPQPGFRSLTLLQKFTPHFKILNPRLATWSCKNGVKESTCTFFFIMCWTTWSTKLDYRVVTKLHPISYLPVPIANPTSLCVLSTKERNQNNLLPEIIKLEAVATQQELE